MLAKRSAYNKLKERSSEPFALTRNQQVMGIEQVNYSMRIVYYLIYLININQGMFLIS